MPRPCRLARHSARNPVVSLRKIALSRDASWNTAPACVSAHLYLAPINRQPRQATIGVRPAGIPGSGSGPGSDRESDQESESDPGAESVQGSAAPAGCRPRGSGCNSERCGSKQRDRSRPRGTGLSCGDRDGCAKSAPALQWWAAKRVCRPVRGDTREREGLRAAIRASRLAGSMFRTGRQVGLP